MKKQLLFLFGSLLLFSNSSSAQNNDWRSSILKENANYYDIVAENETRLLPLRNLTDRNSKKQVKQFDRWAAFWKDRILPDGSFVSAAHTYNAWKNEKQRQNNLRLNGRNVNSVNWTLIGPSTLPTSSISFYPGMGRLNAIAFNGTDTNTMYVGSPAGGVWKTTNGGTTWSPKGDELANLGVSDIVINPTNTGILYLATGDWDGVQNRSIGVFKSIDGGDNWTATGLTFSLLQNNLISKLLIDPNNVNTVFATTKNSIQRTTDGGTTWTDVFTENNANFNDINYKIGSTSVLYATSKSGKFYISTNNGANWSVASSPSSSRLDLALTADDTDLILTLDTNGVLRRSIDQGSTWTTVSTISGYNPQGGYNMTLAISPLDKNLVLAGGVEGWRSTNGGAAWEKYLDGYWVQGNPYFYVHSDHHDMKFIPGTNTAFSVNDGGIFRGDASINTPWTDLSSGLAIAQYYNVSGTPQDAGKLIAGAQDNDIAVFDGGTVSGENPGTDGVEGLWDYSNSDIAWTCSQGGLIYRTTNGFVSSQYIGTPSGAPFAWELEIHPTIPTTIFGGFEDIHKSTDRGDNWTSLNSGLQSIEYISISPSDPDVIYVSDLYWDVKRTTDGGTSWTSITTPQVGGVKSIEVHPTNPSEVYFVYSGYQSGKVYKSTDSGANWTNITGSLPNIPMSQIRYKTASTDGELFLATDLGVYYRTNTVGDWVKLGTGLPNVIVNDLEIHYATEKLRVATFGRGVWEAPIDAASLNIEKEQLAENAVSIFPNPTKNKRFNIKLNNLTGETTILIYNVIGSVIKEFKTNSIEENVNLASHSSGLYLVKFTNNNKSITKKIILN